MNRFALPSLLIAASALAACQSEAEQQADATGDRIEAQAEASAATGAETIAAFGMTERQLLDADLVTADGNDLGDVEQIVRAADGSVEGVVVEIDDSSPDRYVLVPVAGLTVRTSGDDRDLQTTMTAADLGRLSDYTPPAAAAGSQATY